MREGSSVNAGRLVGTDCPLTSQVPVFNHINPCIVNSAGKVQATRSTDCRFGATALRFRGPSIRQPAAAPGLSRAVCGACRVKLPEPVVVR